MVQRMYVSTSTFDWFILLHDSAERKERPSSVGSRGLEVKSVVLCICILILFGLHIYIYTQILGLNDVIIYPNMILSELKKI